MSPVRVSKRHGPDPVDVRCGQFVRMARLEAGLSQEKLADHLGVTFQQVQKYEKGTNRVAPSRLSIIARVTGKPITFFYGEEGTAPPVEAKAIDMDLYRQLGKLSPGMARAMRNLINAAVGEDA